MPRVVLVTDSSACLPAPEVEHPSLRVLPISILLLDGDIPDGPEAAEATYSALRQEKLVKSSPPSAMDYLRTIEDPDFDAAVVLTPASQFTVMHHNAQIAARLADRPVEIVDTRTAAAAQGLVVLAAWRVLVAGGSVEEIADGARQAASRVELVAALPSVDQIQRSGRVPAPALVATRDSGSQPLFRFHDGAVIPLAGESSSDASEGPIEAMARAWRSRGGPDTEEALVFHAAAAHEARRLREHLRGTERMVPFSPAMAVHTGPGCFGVSWLRPTAP